MSIGDEDIDSEIRPDGPLDGHIDSDMSLDEDVECTTGLENTYTVGPVKTRVSWAGLPQPSNAPQEILLRTRLSA